MKTILPMLPLAAFLFSSCGIPKYVPAEQSIDLPQKLGLSAAPMPTMQQAPTDSQYTINDSQIQSTANPSPSPYESTVQAKFAVFEVRRADASESATFKAQLFPQIAPRTVANFEEKANSKFYDGLMFHRVEDWVVQGGDPKGNGTGGGTMRTELNKQPFIAGSLGMARGNNINLTNDSQFFVILRQVYGLDEQYTNFGQIIEGASVVAAIKKGDIIESIRVH